MPLQGIVVSHTHWDRAWYWPFEPFRIRLVETIDQIIALLDGNPAFRAFVLDGQTIVLEDYLEIRPERRADLVRLVQAERLWIGPWYILPDEFLVSGEALVRNLMIGTRICRAYGRTMREGYVPDPFGHIAQLPQILAGFGLRSFIFSRGMGPEIEELGSEFWWEGPDGTRILAINQADNYDNLAAWGFPFGFGDIRHKAPDMAEAERNVTVSLERMRPYLRTGHVLFNNGCDHLPVQPEVPELIDHVNGRRDDVELRHGTFADLVDAILADNPDLKVRRGEMIGNVHRPILLSVYSARMYLKQANFVSQRLLERYAEPLAVLARIRTGRRYDAFLDQAWKTLLKNHPHDDICGCSVDAVHRENAVYFEKVDQIGGYVAEDAVNETVRAGLASRERALFLWNPLNRERDAVEPVEVRVPLDEKGRAPSAIRLLDEVGREVPFQLEETGELYRREVLTDIRYRTYSGWIKMPAIPGCGWTFLRVEAGTPHDLPTGLQCGDRHLENPHVRITVAEDGSLTVLDKGSGRTYDGINVFEDREDAGDEYTFSWLENGRTLSSRDLRPEVSVVRRGPLAATLRIAYEWALPEGLLADRSARSRRTRVCRVVSEVTLTAASPRIEFRTAVDNRVEDHRLQVCFPLGMTVDHCVADGHFGTVERPVGPEKMPTAAEPFEYYRTRHQGAFVSAGNGREGLVIANRGLPEYEVRPDAGNAVIAVTLLRCVGWLSRFDLMTRPVGAGPDLPTPEAQCPGGHVFEYALIPYGTGGDAAARHEAHAFANPVYRQSVALPQETPHRGALVTIDHPDLMISAIKPAADEPGAMVVRVHNTGDGTVHAALRCGFPVDGAARTDLNENDLETLAVDDGERVALAVGPHAIVTLKLRMKE